MDLLLGERPRRPTVDPAWLSIRSSTDRAGMRDTMERGSSGKRVERRMR